MRRSKPYMEGYHDPMPDLTERQAEIIEFIRQWWADHGYGPSMQDIGDGLAISKWAASKDVCRLRRKGVLKYTPGIRRSVRLPDSSKSQPSQEEMTR